ncbi:S24 family peptidase [Bradyrhizobium sp. Leo121]|uniref:LexA family transcriptional regulator n=1 Tax=Bradyrhizobium sp. Leo121 TaxID=1571195 RepID=UPI00102A77BD|nr:S24 family peptidase [Bradyrhizobium sp. Leo121]RZN30479.1 hypothetical protein CWO90_20295 [Bradyrhizobium sp. Leo121]
MITNDLLKERLKEAIEKKQTNPTELAVQIGRDRTYFRDFLKGKKRSVGNDALAQAAEILEVSLEWLNGRSGTSFAVPRAMPHASDLQVRNFTKMIPLYGQAVPDIDGSFSFTEIANVPCPPKLTTVVDPYAVMVSGDVMEPRLHPSNVVYVDPSRSPRRGDDVVLKIQNRQDIVTGYIREYVSLTESGAVVQQLNPPKKTTFKRSEIISIHPVYLIEK